MALPDGFDWSGRAPSAGPRAMHTGFCKAFRRVSRRHGGAGGEIATRDWRTQPTVESGATQVRCSLNKLGQPAERIDSAAAAAEAFVQAKSAGSGQASDALKPIRTDSVPTLYTVHQLPGTARLTSRGNTSRRWPCTSPSPWGLSPVRIGFKASDACPEPADFACTNASAAGGGGIDAFGGWPNLFQEHRHLRSHRFRRWPAWRQSRVAISPSATVPAARLS